MASGRPPDGSFVPVGLNLGAKAARKPSLGALGTLVALLEPSWGLFGRSWGVPGRSWAPLGGRFGTFQGLIQTIWTLSVAQREIQQKHRILRCFLGFQGLPERSESASKIGPKSFQDVARYPRSVWRAQVEVHEAQVGSESGSWAGRKPPRPARVM